MRIIYVLNRSKSLKNSAEVLGISERSIYRFIQGYKLKKIEGSWVQVED
jgi:predicted transcriptional regulator YheO